MMGSPGPSLRRRKSFVAAFDIDAPAIRPRQRWYRASSELGNSSSMLILVIAHVIRESSPPMSDKTKKPRMSDIARALSVSQATVSLVLNNAPGTRISAHTRERVERVAGELGYQKLPQPHKPGRMLGLLINELTTTQHAASLLEGVRDEAAARDCLVTIIATQGAPEAEVEALDYLMARPLIGVIYATLLTQEASPPARLLDIPSVLLNCYSRKGEYVSVVPGDVAGGFTATTALLEAGHRRIAYINNREDWIQASRDRLLGYRQALTTQDIGVDPSLIVSGGWTLASGREQAHRLLSLPSPPTAIFCFCDRMALGVYDAVLSRGLRIPEDLSIVGFDDESFAGDMDPPLTTVLLPHEEMGRWAVSQLTDTPHDRAVPISRRRLKMECRLVERQSVARRSPDGSPPIFIAQVS